MNQADDLKKEAVKALEDFQANAPFTADFTATHALDQIAAMRAHLNMLKAQEAEIRKGLGIFKIDHPMSKDLQALEKVRGSLVFVLPCFQAWCVSGVAKCLCFFVFRLGVCQGLPSVCASRWVCGVGCGVRRELDGDRVGYFSQ
jgi:hypothetical protein